MSSSFAQLGVPESICAALSQRGITEPFEIQAATIADAMADRDVCGRAPTGSGKTLAFGIPLVANVERAEPRRPKALVLAPTRELADQITTELRTFAGKVRVGVVYGGVGYGGQLKSLQKGVDILVACPGRLEDLLEQGALELSDVDRVVLDEADRMADMGFMPAVRRLLDQTRRKRQTVLFSATLDGDVAKLTKEYQHHPVRHEVGQETPDIKAARHVFWNVSQDERTEVTATAIQAAWPAIVFCRTRHGSDRLAKRLNRSGVDAVAIHGGRSQSQRTRALADFSRGHVQALVATDVAARGIHVDGVAAVVHYDPPADHKDYVHRSGRTARAGESGVVVSLVQPNQAKDTRRLQRQVGIDEPVIDPDAGDLRGAAPTRTRQPTVEVGLDEREERGERRSRPPRRKPKSTSARRGDKTGNRKRRPSGPKANSRGTSPSKPAGSGSGSKDSGGKKSRQPKSGATAGSGKGRGPKSKTKTKTTQKVTTGGTKPHRSGGPNRKARRAHLQPSA